MTTQNECSVCLTFDFDAMSLWIGTFGATSPSMISRGEFGKIGALRILDLLAKYNLKTSWFIPGHTVEAFPDIVKRVQAEGHEIGHHGYCHENPVTLKYDEEKRVMERGIEAIERVTGTRPAGYRSPAWDMSPHTIDFLLEYHFTYDSSLMANDFQPYWCRKGDQWSIDTPFVFGEPTSLVEVPVTWWLDDFPPSEFVWQAQRINPGLYSPSHVYELWSSEFDYMYENVPGGVYNIAFHPQVSGRGNRIVVLEKLINHMKSREGVRFERIGDYVQRWLASQKKGGTSADS